MSDDERMIQPLLAYLQRYGNCSLILSSTLSGDKGKSGSTREYQVDGRRIRVKFIQYDDLGDGSDSPHTVEAEMTLPDFRDGNTVVLYSTRVRRVDEVRQLRRILTDKYERLDFWDIPLLEEETRFNAQKVHR